MSIKNLSGRLAYLRGYHRGRATGRRLALQDVVRVAGKKADQPQMVFHIRKLTNDKLIELIQKL